MDFRGIFEKTTRKPRIKGREGELFWGCFPESSPKTESSKMAAPMFSPETLAHQHLKISI